MEKGHLGLFLFCVMSFEKCDAFIVRYYFAMRRFLHRLSDLFVVFPGQWSHGI